MRKASLTLAILIFALRVCYAEAQQSKTEGSPYTNIASLRANADSLDDPEAYLHFYIAEAERNPNKPKVFLDCINKAITIAREQIPGYSTLHLYGLKSRFYNERGHYVKTAASYIEGLEDSTAFALADLEDKGWYTIDLGNMLYKLEIYQEAYLIYQEAHNCFQQIDDGFGMSVALNNKGLVKSRLKEQDSAIYYYDKALQLRLFYCNDPMLIAHCYLYKAQAYIADSLLAEAREALQIADELAQVNAKERNFDKEIYAQWSDLYLELNRNRKALFFANKILEDESELFGFFYDIEAYRILAQSYEQMGLLDSAVIFAMKGYSLSKDFGQNAKKSYFLRQLIDLNQQLGEQPKVEYYYHELIPLSDILENERQEVLELLLRTIRKNQENKGTLSGLQLEAKKQSKTIENQRFWVTMLALASLVILVCLLALGYFYKRLKKARLDLILFAKRALSVSNSVEQVIFSLDQEKNLIFFNHAAQDYFENFLGFEPRLHLPFLEQISNDTTKVYWTALLKDSKNKISWQNTVQLKNSQGKEHYFLQAFSSFYDHHSDNYEGLAVLITDFTESFQKNIELTQQRNQLKKAVSAKDKVLSVLAHDLKEGIIGSYELTKQMMDSQMTFSKDEMEQAITLINSSLGRTKTLLFKTLEWVKQQSDGLKVNQQKVRLLHLVNDLANSMRSTAEAKNLQIKVEGDAAMRVQTDPNLTRTVLRNLISNAIKFTPASGQPIQVHLVKKEDQCEVQVIDHGTGIDRLTLNKIMSRENLQSQAGTDGEIGSGVGLSLCHQFLSLQGSRLEVASEIGVGTTFCFKVPLDPSA